MAMQYGGWYDNPTTGQNQRWFNGTWTSGLEPGQSQNNPLSNILGGLDAQTNAYVDRLIANAQGDTDFAIKQLTREHELALGTNDQERAKFLESVADALESKIGTIPYDYQVATGRENQDIGTFTERNKANLDKVISRLNEDEQVWKAEQAQSAKEGRQTQNEQLSQRGLIQGTRENAQGIGGKEVGTFEKKIADQLATYDRLLGRSKADVTQESTQALTDAQLASQRRLEDLKTATRRGATGAQDAFTYGTEAQKRALEARKAALEEQRKLSLAQNASRTLQVASNL